MMLLCSSWLCIDRSRRGPPPFRRAHPVIYSARGDQDSRALPDVVTDFACLFWTDFPRLPQLRPKIMRLRSLTEMLVLIPFPVLYQSDRHSFFRLFLTWLLHHLILEMFPEQNTVNFVCFTMKSENKTANSNAFTHLYAFLCFAKPSGTVRMQRARRWCRHFISPGQKYHVDFSLHLILADAATFIRCMNMWCFLM